MTLLVDDIDDLRMYLQQMMTTGRPGDSYPRIQHADQVKGTVLTIAGALTWRADKDSIRIRENSGRTTNQVWFTVNGRQYALTYNHATIGLHDRNTAGNVLHSFDDKTTSDKVYTAFAGL